MKNPETFIVRIYGIILNAENEVLLTDEFQLNTKMTKFPGGGLKYGEGTIDCLRREFRRSVTTGAEEYPPFLHYRFFSAGVFL
jgi:8-oxo-dGTP diphosphatase